jgi:hypothetical protein
VITRDDMLWILVSLGILSVAVLLQSRELARLRDEVAFAKLAASAAFITERET